MKSRIYLPMILLGIGTIGTAFGQSKKPTLVAVRPVSNPASSSIHPSAPTHNLHVRLRQELSQIQKDLKSGKLTSAQAASLRQSARAVRVQELQMRKQNGSYQLTSEQISQLNSQLDKINSSL
jgi:hypothetical protein